MIKLEFNKHIASMLLDHPPVNAINYAWLDGMNTALDEIEANDNVSVLHIRSACKVFCAGADLALMRELLSSGTGRDEMIEIIRKMQQVFFRIEAMDIVTLAEIGGAALGGGFELTLACDLRAADASAKLGLPEAGLGLLPAAGGTQRLTHIAGEAIAKRLIFSAEVITGEQACNLGLVQWCKPANELADFTRELAQRISSMPEHALASCNHCIDASLDDSINGFDMELEETRKLHDIKETQDRIRNFLDKTK